MMDSQDMPRQPGERIGAIRCAEEDLVLAFGFGIYEGDEIPPEDVRGTFWRPGLLGFKSPKLRMDDGTVVWGCECWWASESQIRKRIGGRKVEIVKPERSGPTEEERRMARETPAGAERERARRMSNEQSDDLVLYAWIGEDELGSGRSGIKQGHVPAGYIPLVAMDYHLDRLARLLPVMEALAETYGKKIRLMEFRATGHVVAATKAGA